MHAELRRNGQSKSNSPSFGIEPAFQCGMNFQKEVNGLETKIHLIREVRVMLDFDLAELYQVPTKRLKEQVKRNQKRFPPDFLFILSEEEFAALRSQIATSNIGRDGHRHVPFAFTEHGVAMLSSILNSKRAIEANIAIMRAFAQMRRVLISSNQFENKLQELAAKYDMHDRTFKVVFDALRKLMSIQSVPHKRIAGLGKKGACPLSSRSLNLRVKSKASADLRATSS